MACIVLATIIALGLGIFSAQKITKSITDVSDVLKEVASGVLTCKLSKKAINRKDELGLLASSLAYMVTEMRSLIRNINQMSNQVTALSKNLTGISHQTATSADEIADRGNCRWRNESGARYRKRCWQYDGARHNNRQ